MSLRLQVDFLQVALEENVLELVALITQHIGNAHLRCDAPVVLELLHDIYRVLSPKDVFGANEDLLLSRARCAAATLVCCRPR